MLVAKPQELTVLSLAIRSIPMSNARTTVGELCSNYLVVISCNTITKSNGFVILEYEVGFNFAVVRRLVT